MFSFFFLGFAASVCGEDEMIQLTELVAEVTENAEQYPDGTFSGLNKQPFQVTYKLPRFGRVNKLELKVNRYVNRVDVQIIGRTSDYKHKKVSGLERYITIENHNTNIASITIQ